MSLAHKMSKHKQEVLLLLQSHRFLAHLLQAKHFGLEISDGGVALVFLLSEIPVGDLQFREPGLKLLGAPLVS